MSESTDTEPGFGNRRVREIYRNGMYDGETPPYPIAYEDLREAAWERMDERARAYVHGGSGTEETFRRNRDFSAHRIVPRMLRGVADRSLSVELFDTTQEFPVMVTPLGVQSLLHDEGELATARACAALDVPFTLSSLSSTPMEDVAEALGDTTKWFQFYWSSDRAVARSFLDRAAAAGYDAIVLTVDAPTLGWRDRLLERGYYPFLDGEGVANYFSDPAFREALEVPPEEDPQAAVDLFLEIFGDESLTWSDLRFLREHTDLPIVVKGVLHPEDARLALDHGADAVQVSTHGGRQVDLFLEIFGDESLTWSDLRFLREHTDLPIVVKGVLHPEDARLALDHGADAVQVSTHGGRQVDGSISAVEALPAVADAVGDDAPVLFDSGIRRGSDAFKALGLGADAVMIGRPFAYGLALDGRAGVEWVLENVISELDLTMGLAGYDDVTDVGPEALRHETEL